MKEIYNINGKNVDNGYIIPCFGKGCKINIKKANSSEEDRVKICTSLAAISTGKNESSNPNARFKALLKEAAYNTASRPLEFIPVVLDMYITHCDCEDEVYGVYLKLKNNKYESFFIEDYLNKIAKFSFVKCIKHIKNREHYKLYTNMRCLLNAGINYEDIPYNKPSEVKDFYAFKLKIPMFVFNHIITHTQLSKVTKSDRVTSNSTKSLWFPDDFYNKCKEYKFEMHYKNDKKRYEDLLLDILLTDGDMEEITKLVQVSYPQETFRELLKQLGYKKEIYQRAILEMRYKEFSIAGWNNKYGWKNFLAERGAMEDWQTWPQKETVVVAKLIKKCLGE